MQTYDLIMLLVLVGTTIFGFWKGMAWQIASLASFVLSYFAALRFSTQLAPYFGDNAPLNRIGAMLAIYAATSFVIWTIFRLVSTIIDRVKLENFDRQLGAVLGLAKGVLLCIVITFFAVSLLPPAQGQAISATRSGHYIVVLLNKAQAVVPPELQEAINPYLNSIEQQLGGAGPQPQGANLQEMWPQANTPQPQVPNNGWPQQGQTTWPQTTPQTPPPSSPWPAQSNPTLPAWPTGTQSPSDIYRATSGTTSARPPANSAREPNPFPGPDAAKFQNSGR
jgi:membrane protein required for colicin V production